MKKFKKNERVKNIIIIGLILVIGIVVGAYLYKSFAYFETSKTYNILEGQIPNFTKGDITLAVIVDGKEDKSGEFPDKKNHRYIETKCSNNLDAEINFDKDTWKLSLSNIDRATICTIVFETKTNSLNGSEPVIKDGLVPVIISNDGTVTKTTTDDDNWYDYNESKWANAVILTGIDNYSVEQTIPEDNIESYFVWIPKYRYKLFNVEGNEIPSQEIEIEFGTTNTTDTDSSCIATNESGNIGTCTNGKWMTHPAFTSLGVNGIWVGKFETTGTTDKVTVKPNVTSIRSQTVLAMYNAAKTYKTGLDSHMMKNIEWGAMAYLTNSKYGRGNSEVWVNNYWNNWQSLTGCTAFSVSDAINTTTICAQPYGSGGENIHGSTTDNVSGIYDTSGGSWEYVMGNYNNTAGASGMSSFPDTRYYDKYTGTDASYKILGDATGETKGWNSDYDIFVSSSNPWFIRGGDSGLESYNGVFSFNATDGLARNNVSFRIVLSPSK